MLRLYIFYFANSKTPSMFLCEAATEGRKCGNRSDTDDGMRRTVSASPYLSQSQHQEEETASLVPSQRRICPHQRKAVRRKVDCLPPYLTTFHMKCRRAPENGARFFSSVRGPTASDSITRTEN